MFDKEKKKKERGTLIEIEESQKEAILNLSRLNYWRKRGSYKTFLWNNAVITGDPHGPTSRQNYDILNRKHIIL